MLRIGQLYLWHTRGKQLLRFIAHDIEKTQLLFKVVAPKWSRDPTQVLQWGREKALKLMDVGRLEEYPEQVRPNFMSWTDDELIHQFQASRQGVDVERNRHWISVRNEDNEKLGALVDHDAMFATYSPVTAATAVRERVRELTGRSERDLALEQDIRRLLHRYAWFGMGANALLQLTHQCGHTNEYVRKFSVKTGAPNALVKLGGSDRYAGRNVTEKDIENFIDALRRWYVKKDYSLRETYDLMVEFLYVQKTKTPAGEDVVYPVSVFKIPTFFVFVKRASELVKQLRFDVDKAGHKDGKELEARKGYDDDIVRRVGDLFCMDATSFNKEGVLKLKYVAEVLNVGRDTAVVVRDRKSGDPRGWHIYSGAENWGEGYRLAMFCAITSKRRHLEYLEIDDPDAWKDEENIVPLGVVVDNGPGASEDAQAAFERLDIRYRPTAPNNPAQKGGEEAMIGRVQAAQSHDPGGVRRTNRERDREVRRKAAQFASEDTWDIERKLVMTLIKERRTRNKHHLVTIEMKRAGVQPFSADIVRWSIREMGGIQSRRMSEAEVYLALLKHKTAGVRKDGVKFKGAWYDSERLQAYRRVAQGKLSIKVLYHPTRPEEAYWVTSDGELDVLEREERGGRLYGHMSHTEYDEYLVRDNARARLEQEKRQKANKRKKGKVTVAQHEQLKNMASRLPVRQRTRVTDDTIGARRLALAQQRANRPYDKQPVHVPNLAGMRVQGSADKDSTPGTDPDAEQLASEAQPSTPKAPSTATPSTSTILDSTEDAQAPRPGRRVRSADLWRARLLEGRKE